MDKKQPTRFRVTALNELNADIKIKLPGFRLLARFVATPVPIDLPKIIIFFSSNPIYFTKKS